MKEIINGFKGIQRYGTDFSMIATLLPDKTRLQIKVCILKVEISVFISNLE